MTNQTNTTQETLPKEPAKMSLKFKRILAISAVFFNYSMFGVVSILIAYGVFTLNLYIALAMVGLMIFQKLFLRRNLTIVNFLMRHFHPETFFNKFQKIFQDQVPDEGVLFAVHPHGVWSLGLILGMNYGNDPYSRLTQLGSRFILNLPIVGMFLRIWGVESVHASNMNKLMSKRVNIGLVPGGYQQATLTSEDKFRIYIKRRKGFIKMALKTGYKICPVLIMNEHKMYKTTDFALKFRLFLNKLKLPGALFFGRFGLLPDYNLDIYTIIGKPIEMPTIQKPSTDEIKKWHKHYIETVTTMYEKYKGLNNNSPFEIY